MKILEFLDDFLPPAEFNERLLAALNSKPAPGFSASACNAAAAAHPKTYYRPRAARMNMHAPSRRCAPVIFPRRWVS